MEPVTHILSGALLARALYPAIRPGDSGRPPAPLPLKAALLCGAAASAFPDIDLIAIFFGQIAYLLNHRGITHSLIVLPLWALLLAVLSAALARQRFSWRAFYPYAFAGLLLHVLFDLITSYGTMILAPFSDRRFDWGITFIFDLWLSGILLAGLLLSWRWRHSRIPAVALLAVLLGYLGCQTALKQQAIAIGQDYARTHALRGISVHAMPQAFSPFRWMILIQGQDRYWYTHLNLWHQEAPAATDPNGGWLSRFHSAFPSAEQAVWQPVSAFGNDSRETALAHQVFNHPRFAFYRWFAAYPALYRIEHRPDGDCAWFEDLRFKFPGLERSTFRFGMCLAGNEWQPMRWSGAGTRKPLE